MNNSRHHIKHAFVQKKVVNSFFIFQFQPCKARRPFYSTFFGEVTNQIIHFKSPFFSSHKNVLNNSIAIHFSNAQSQLNVTAHFSDLKQKKVVV